MSFAERFQLLELLREGEVETFRALDQTTGRAVEVHLSGSAESLAKLEPVIDHGSYEGKLYVVTSPSGLESAGAWRIQAARKAPPGEFTQMFELLQVPEPVATPSAKAVHAPAAPQPGEFTRAFKRPVTAPLLAPENSLEADAQGEFTRMFQKPVPAASTPASQGTGSETRAPSRVPVGLIVTAIAIISAIAVFVLVRTLY